MRADITYHSSSALSLLFAVKRSALPSNPRRSFVYKLLDFLHSEAIQECLQTYLRKYGRWGWKSRLFLTIASFTCV